MNLVSFLRVFCFFFFRKVFSIASLWRSYQIGYGSHRDPWLTVKRDFKLSPLLLNTWFESRGGFLPEFSWAKYPKMSDVKKVCWRILSSKLLNFCFWYKWYLSVMGYRPHGRTDGTSASGAVESGSSSNYIKPTTLKFTASLLDVRHGRDEVENKLTCGAIAKGT